MTKEYIKKIGSKLALNDEIEALKKNNIDGRENSNATAIAQAREGNFSEAGVIKSIHYLFEIIYTAIVLALIYVF